jgi:hypothetical protein
VRGYAEGWAAPEAQGNHMNPESPESGHSERSETKRRIHLAVFQIAMRRAKTLQDGFFASL